MTQSVLKRAAAILKRGGVIAYPTESCFGLGCDPRNPEAIRRLLRLKRRPWHKGLIVIGGHYRHVSPFLRSLTADQKSQTEKSWPGPVTWIIPAKPSTPLVLRGNSRGLAVRVTAHKGAAALCAAFGGGIVSTSANRSGRPAAGSVAEVKRQFGSALDFILPGALGGRDKPSDIIDLLSNTTLR